MRIRFFSTNRFGITFTFTFPWWFGFYLQIDSLPKDDSKKTLPSKFPKTKRFRTAFLQMLLIIHMIIVTGDTAVQGVLCGGLSLYADKIPFQGEKNRLNLGRGKNIGHD